MFIVPSAFSELTLNPVVDEKLDVFCYNSSDLVSTFANATVYNTSFVYEFTNLTQIEKGHFLLNISNYTDGTYTVMFDCGTEAVPRYKFGTFIVELSSGVNDGIALVLVGVGLVFAIVLLSLKKSSDEENSEISRKAANFDRATGLAIRWLILAMSLLSLVASTGYALILSVSNNLFGTTPLVRSAYFFSVIIVIVIMLIMVVYIIIFLINKAMSDSQEVGRRRR